MSLFSFLVTLKKKYLSSVPMLKQYEPVIVLEKVFSKEECEAIMSLGTSVKLRAGMTLGGGERGNEFHLDTRERDVEVGQILFSDDTEWLYKKLYRIIERANKNYYNFTIVWFKNELQFLKYEKEGHYDWHCDIGRGHLSNRKIIFSLQLTDPGKYEGGELDFFTHAIVRVPRTQGTLVLSPSFIYHRVLPVTSGERYSLIGRIYGPTFR